MWQDEAACQGHNPDWWVNAETSDEIGRKNNQRALVICSTCPVKQECAEWGYATGSVGMIFGGTKRTPRSPRGEYMANNFLRNSDTYSGSGSINRRPRPV